MSHTVRRTASALLIALLCVVVAPSRADALTGLDWEESGTTVSGTKYLPIQGRFNNDATTDILWYTPGEGPDSFWFLQSRREYIPKSVTLNGTYRVLVGDFAGNDAQDLLFYAPGSKPDSLWISNGNMTFTKRSLSISGADYRPVALTDWRAGGKDDILWWEPGREGDRYWHFSDSGNGSYSSRAHSINGIYYVVVKGLFNGDPYDDVVFYGPGTQPDTLWLVSGNGTITRRSLSVDGAYWPQSFYRAGSVIGGLGTSGIYWLNQRPDGGDVMWRARSNGTFQRATTKRWGGQRDLDGTDLFWLGLNQVAVRSRDSRDVYVVDNGTTDNIGPLNEEERFGDVGWSYQAISNDADFDGDGWADILWYGRGSAVDAFWFRDVGAGAPRAAAIPSPGSAPQVPAEVYDATSLESVGGSPADTAGNAPATG